MNKVFLIGNLTADPKLTETKAGLQICRFSIAVSHKISGGDSKTDFYNVVAYGGLADIVNKYTKKGSKISVVGNIDINTYTDKNGVERVSVDITANDVEFLTPKPAGETPEDKPKRSLSQIFDDDAELPFD